MNGHYEDLAVGTTLELGTHHFTAEAIKAFARDYDPQAFHLDEAAAVEGPFGRLAASGWHTVAVWMKLNVAFREADRADAEARGETPVASGPSPGFANLRWIKPVFAGDTLTYFVTVADKRVVSRPGWGLVAHRGFAINQDGDEVLSFEGQVFWPRRPVASP